MKAVICVSNPNSMGSMHMHAKALGLQTPMIPHIGRPTTDKFRSNAFSPFAMDYSTIPLGPFSFIRPDVPPKGTVQKQSIKTAKVELAGDEKYQSKSSPVPRFRSALEQVSYLTNQSIMKQR